MKYSYLFGSVILGSVLLSGCTMDTDKDAKNVDVEPSKVETVEENGPAEGTLEFYMDKVNKGEVAAPGELGVKEYEVSDYTSPDKAKYYDVDSILVTDELKQAEESYLVYYFSPLCVYCNEFYDVLRGYEDLADGYKVYKVNVDVKENLPAWKDIEGTPTMKLVTTGSDGKKSSEVVSIGYVSLDQLPVNK